MQTHTFKSCLLGEAPELHNLPTLVKILEELDSSYLIFIRQNFNTHPIINKIIDTNIEDQLLKIKSDYHLNNIIAHYKNSNVR